jgi:hypothetical protein
MTVGSNAFPRISGFQSAYGGVLQGVASIIDCSGAPVVAESDGLSENAKNILEQFPGPVTLYPSKLKWSSTFVITVFVGAMGAWSLLWGQYESPIGVNWHTFEGAFLIIVGGGGAAVTGWGLVASTMYLTLDATGFVCRAIWPYARCSWKDADRFTTVDVMLYLVMVHRVAFDDATHKTGFWSTLTRAVCGRNNQLPDAYGLRAEDLARLLTAWRERALGSPR